MFPRLALHLQPGLWNGEGTQKQGCRTPTRHLCKMQQEMDLCCCQPLQFGGCLSLQPYLGTSDRFKQVSQMCNI